MKTATEAEMEARIDGGIADLAVTYLKMLDDQLDELALLSTRLVRDPDSATGDADLAAVTGLAHRIAGSAGSFGFDEVSRAARALENLVRTADRAATMRGEGFAEETGRLVRALIEAPRVFSGWEVPLVETARAIAAHRRPIYVIDSDAEAAATVAERIKPFGYDARVFTSGEALLDAVATEQPAALVSELGFGDDDTAGAGLASRLAGTVPTIIVSERADFAAHLAAARGGCAAYLHKPLESLELVNWIDELTGQRPGAALRILVVDDDELLAEHHGSILRAAGMTVQVLTDPRTLLTVLGEFAPDLVLMDMYMPDCTGAELARVVRQHRKYLGLPIVFLSVENDVTRQLSALSPGADDFLTKPIAPDHLVQALRLRATRARDLRSVMETDSLTGLYNHAHLKERLSFEQCRAERTGSPLVFALLDLDHFKRVNDVQGHLAGDRVIRSLARVLVSRLRRTDIIGRYGGEEFGVVLPDTDAAAAVAVLNDIRETFEGITHTGNLGSFHVTLSCGAAKFQADAAGDDHIRRADEALYVAKAEGRNVVRVHIPASPVRGAEPLPSRGTSV